MAYLKLYKNATPGGTDGVEVTTADVITMLGFFPATDVYGDLSNRSKTLLLCLRCDPGHSASAITIDNAGTNESRLTFIGTFTDPLSDSQLSQNNGNSPAGNYYYYYSPLTISNVGETNVGFAIMYTAPNTTENGLTIGNMQMTISFTEV